jgi:hypothetical protein
MVYIQAPSLYKYLTPQRLIRMNKSVHRIETALVRIRLVLRYENAH